MTKAEMESRIREMIRELAPVGTTFRWGTAKRRFGSCGYTRNRLTGECYNFKITISYSLACMNTWEEVRKVVLHEIAHARTPGHHHDRVWVRECLAIGGDGKRCYDTVEQGGGVNVMPHKYIGVCPKCGARFPRNRRTNGAYHCDRAYKIVWTVNSKLLENCA